MRCRFHRERRQVSTFDRLLRRARGGSIRSTHLKVGRLLVAIRAALSALLLCLVAPALHAEALTPRPLLATGDLVPGFGRIGTGAFSLLGIADDGRLLVTGNLSDGRQGLFWANDHQLVPLWISGDTPGVTLDVQHAVASGNGNVLASAYAGNQWNQGFYYVFSQGAVPRVVIPARTDRAGNTLCWIDAAVINDAGTIAFHATIAPPGTDCTALPDWPLNAIYSASSAETNEVVSSTDLAPDAPTYVYMNLIGLTRDGRVIASAYESPANAWRIFAVRDGVVRTLVAPGDPGPDGVPLTGISVGNANDFGEVLFTASAGAHSGLYRTEQGRIVNVGVGGDAEALSDGGGVAILTTPRGNSGGVSLVDSAGAASQIFALGPGTAFGRYVNSGGPLLFNATGSLAFTVNAYGGPASLVALRWTAGQIDEVLSSGDGAPDGTALASGGLQKPMCLAADGRLVVSATATTGNDALLCIDAAGPHLIAQDGDPIPEGFTFTGFEGLCTFTDDGGIVFAGDRAVPKYGNGQLYSEASVYRAGAQGIERLFGVGDPVSNGTFIADSGSSVNFVPNHRGSLLIDGYTSDGYGLFLQHDGRLDLVHRGVPAQWALGDDDSVVMIDRLLPSNAIDPRTIDYWNLGGGGGDSVVVSTHGFLYVVATLNSPLTSAPFLNFNNLMVRGDLVLFSATSRSDQQLHEFFYRLGDSQPQEVKPAGLAGHIIDFNTVRQVLTQVADGFQLLAPTGAVTGLIAGSNLDPFALNDAGTIAFVDYEPSGRDVLEVTGPSPGANCPVVPTFSEGSAMTVTPTPTPNLSASPLPGIGSSRAYIADQATDTVAVVDTATQDVLAVVPVPHAPSALAATPDGLRVYALGKDEIGVIDARTAQLIMTFPLPEATNVIAAGPDDDTLYAVAGGSVGRIARVDTGTGIVSSVLVGALHNPLRFAPGGGILVAGEQGNVSSTSRVAFFDTATGATVSSTDPGICAVSAAFGPNLSDVYVVDGCRNALELVDVQTGQVTEDLLTEQWSAQLGRLEVTADGRRAYASQPGYSVFSNPDGSLSPAQGSVSAIDLMNHSASTITVPGQPDHLALTADGSLLYVTIVQPGPGQVAVVDTARNTVRTTLLLGGAPADVVVAPAPPADAPSPLPTVEGDSNVLLRADSAAGVPGDSVPFSVRLDTGGHDVISIEADMSLFDAGSLGPPGCNLAPEIAGNATIQFAPALCRPSCVSSRFVVRSANPTQSLPHDGLLLSCSVYIGPYHGRLGTFPLLLLNASAMALDGSPLPVITGDGSITVLSADQATPRPTLTASPTAAPTSTATPIVPVPGSFTAGSVGGGAGQVAAVPITIDTGSDNVAFFAVTFAVVPQDGAPAVTDALTYQATALVPAPDLETAVQSAAKLAVGYVGVAISPPLSGQVQVGNLMVPIRAGASGSYQVHLSEISAGDSSGARVTLKGKDGTIELGGSATPTATATPPPASATPASATPTATGNGVQPGAQEASVPQSAGLRSVGGCAITPETGCGSQFWLVSSLVVLALCRERRRVSRPQKLLAEVLSDAAASRPAKGQQARPVSR